MIDTIEVQVQWDHHLDGAPEEDRGPERAVELLKGLGATYDPTAKIWTMDAEDWHWMGIFQRQVRSKLLKRVVNGTTDTLTVIPEWGRTSKAAVTDLKRHGAIWDRTTETWLIARKDHDQLDRITLKTVTVVSSQTKVKGVTAG